MNLQIRPALDSDGPAIHDVLLEAFGDDHGGEIAQLVTDLLEDTSATPRWSLVAVADRVIAGHILFTKARIVGASPRMTASILAPLAVRPAFQGRGLGGRLISDGIDRLKAAAVDLVFVLGHPGYYPRHGFAPAGKQGLDAPYPIAPEDADAWMVQELHAGSMDRASGRLVCAESLSDPRFWRE